MNSKHRRTLAAVFENPIRSDVRWSDIEALFRALDAKIVEGSGSRVRVRLNDAMAVFHRPHPKPYTDKAAVKSVRMFLENTGVRP